MASLREITDKPIKYIINTHFHHDHSDGNRCIWQTRNSDYISSKCKKKDDEDVELYGGIYSLLKVLSSLNMIMPHCLYLPMKVK